MKKIIVFDYGMAAYLVGNIIEQEIPFEVEKVLVGGEKELVKKTEWEIVEETREVLRPFIGTAEIIVLANPFISMMAKNYLEQIFPRQKFIGYGWDLPKLLEDTKKALIVKNEKINNIESYQMIKSQCQGTEIIESDSEKWIKIIAGEEEIVDTDLEAEIEKARGGKLVIFNSNLLMMKKRLKKRVGWRVDVVDFVDCLIKKLKHELSLDDYEI